MSVNRRNNILAFIHVIESHSHLIKEPDWVELSQITEGVSDDDDEEIYSRIENWLQPEHRSHISEAYNNMVSNISHSPTPPGQTSQSTKGLLDNTIHINSPSSDNPPSNQ